MRNQHLSVVSLTIALFAMALAVNSCKTKPKSHSQLEGGIMHNARERAYLHNLPPQSKIFVCPQNLHRKHRNDTLIIEGIMDWAKVIGRDKGLEVVVTCDYSSSTYSASNQEHSRVIILIVSEPQGNQIFGSLKIIDNQTLEASISLTSFSSQNNFLRNWKTLGGYAWGLCSENLIEYCGERTERRDPYSIMAPTINDQNTELSEDDKYAMRQLLIRVNPEINRAWEIFLNDQTNKKQSE